MRKQLLCTFFLVVLALSRGTAQDALSIRTMKLLDQQTGWAASDNKVFWTTNGGAEWRDITPKLNHNWQHLSSVFFLNASRGWVLLRCADGTSDGYDDVCFEIASTTDSGASWSIAHPTVTDPDPEAGFSQNGYINFTDSLHGWIILKVNRSTAVSFGVMFATEDGGLTWHELPQPPIAEPFEFVSTTEGWIAGGPNLELYTTHDAGSHWETVSINKPREIGSIRGVVYGLPTFDSPRHGLIPVKYKVGSALGPPYVKLVIFATNDDGKTWIVNRIFPTVPDPSDGWIPVALPDTTPIVPTISVGHIQLLDRKAEFQTEPAMMPMAAANISQVSFLNARRGWVLADSSIVSTSDGGFTWTKVSPHSPPSTLETSTNVPPINAGNARSTSVQQLDVSPGASPTLQTSVHLGFDKSDVVTAAQMQTLMNSSPFYDTFIYIPGSPNRHVDGTLIKDWLTAVENQGWGVVPIWFGLQSECVITSKGINLFFGPTQGEAATDGEDQANLAIAQAATLGINSGIIYVDIENYNSTCKDESGITVTASPIVRAYVNAFVMTIQAHSGYSAGVYANAGPLTNDISKIAHQPNAVWITKTPLAGKPPQVTIWNLSPLSDSLWPNKQRMRQFLIDQTGVIFGGVSFLPSVDEDTNDGPVLRANNHGKTYTYCSSATCYLPFDLGDGTDTEAYDINDANLNQGALVDGNGQRGEIVGIFHDTDGLYHSFLLSAGQWNGIGPTTQFDCGTPEAVNNAGLVAGWYPGADDNEHGFEFNPTTNTCTTLPDYTGAFLTEPRGINDAGWLSGEYQLPSASNAVGFIWESYRKPQFASINYFGSNSTHVAKLNGVGQVAGYTPSTYTSFIGNNINTCSTCYTQLPKVSGTYPTLARSVNNDDQVSGQYAVTSAAGAIVSPGAQTLPIGAFGIEYSAGVSAGFGTAPYTFELTGGQLPPGLTLASNGDISGTPAAIGTFNFSVKVTDSSTPPQVQTISASIQIIAVKGFVYSSDTKSFNTISFPGAPATVATGMNDFGQVVGYYADSAGKIHGFIAVPQQTLK